MFGLYPSDLQSDIPLPAKIDVFDYLPPPLAYSWPKGDPEMTEQRSRISIGLLTKKKS
jgi:hypothetical protein